MNDENETKSEGQLDPLKFNELGELISTNHDNKIDPRQQLCWDYYVESVMNGSPNIYKSALRAGYTEASSQGIANTKWFKDKKKRFKRNGMLTMAEKNLEKIMKMPYMVKKMVKGEEVMEVDTDVLRIIVDVSKSIVKSLGKDEGYSERSEVTGKGGDPIIFMPAELLAKHNLLDNNNK
jgi:hypothetical protein